MGQPFPRGSKGQWGQQTTPPVSSFEEQLKQGEALLSRGLAEDALVHLGRAVALHPTHAKARNKLGVAYAELRRFDEARTTFLEAISLDPTYAAPHSNLGNVHKELGQLDEAVISYQAALRIDPDYPAAHHNLGVVYRELGRVGDAVAQFKQAQRLEIRGMDAKAGSAVAFWKKWGLILVALAAAYLLVRAGR